MMTWFHRMGVPALALAASACSQETIDPTPIGAHAGGTTGQAGQSSALGGGPTSGGGGATSFVPLPLAGSSAVSGAPGGGSSGTPTETCTADFADTGLEPVYLAFAFDVSGSMGKGDEPYHDVELKWKPVVSATKAFFADPSSAKISASLSFFPAEDDKCDASTYEQPDVTMTALPSDAFGSAIDEITPQSSDDWRGGTPTLAVMSGLVQFTQRTRAERGPGQFAMVLVSDGYPQGCDDEDDSIEAVANKVRSVAAELPTYVIGVSNPAGGPDTVSNLNRVAEAGGTSKAFLIQTGDPAQTARDFKTVIDSIRGNSLSCQAAIPTPPDGSTLDTTKVNVSYTSAGVDHALVYDPECTERSAWRYDDPIAPTRLELCDSACQDVRTGVNVKLRVEFGCATRPVIPR